MELSKNHINMDVIYLALSKKLLDAPVVGDTRELNNVSFTLSNINNNIVGIRDISLSYLCGELVWYFSGRRDTKFISTFSKFWNKITDDGETANSAYGYLMKKGFDFDQIEKVIELLEKDPNSRRAKINLNTPNEKVIETKDEPCTMFLQFLIRDGKLNCTAVMRSNDIWLGLPYDVAFFTELQKYIAHRLGLQYGTYTHFVVSLHMYERNRKDIEQIVHDPVCKLIKINNEPLVENAEYLAYVIDEDYIKKDIDPKRKIVDLFRGYEILQEDK